MTQLITRHLVSLCVAALVIFSCSAAPAQEAAVRVEGAAAPDPSKGAPGRPSPGQPGQPGQPQPGQPQPGQPAAGAKPEEKKEATPSVVTRPDKPPLPPDPRELKVEPTPDGKVRFSFHGQRWADVLEWLARISGMSLDWQELPADYLNLVTQREYTVPEARDLINRHLLARGFTLIEQGEILSVVNIQKLNPAMVPRVEPDQLKDRLPHEYVKVSFPLKWLLAEKAVEELKPMLSTNAKVSALKNTNRIEAMDAVVNLQEALAVLDREQSPEDERLVQEFRLNYTRATDVLPQLQTLLGMESKPSSARPGSPEQMEMMQQQAMMMAQMQRQGGQQQPQPQQKKVDDVHLVATRRNTILANAPPDKMEIIGQAIKAIDVEGDPSQSLLTNVNRIKVHRLHTIDPEALVKTLLEVADLDPSTQLQVDTKNKALIVYAGSMADHLTIQQVIEHLDGSTRKFKVIQLRRLDADYVAGTIEFMMAPPKEQQSQSRYYDLFYSPYRRSGQSDEQTDRFRVDADVDNNRLLLWANELEIEEVTNFLVELGEIPSQGGRSDRVRVLDAVSPEDLPQLLERLRRAWPSLAPNPLHLPEVPEAKPQEEEPKPALPGVILPREARNEIDAAIAAGSALALLDDDAVDAADRADVVSGADERPADPPRSEAHAAPPAVAAPTIPGTAQRFMQPDGTPVDVLVTPDGRIMISSQDTKALDVLEELISQVAPPSRDYHVFRLKHASAYWVMTYLEKFFSEEEDKASSGSRSVYYFYDSPPPKKDENRFRLSRRRKLKFIDDPDTNSILVQGADAEQLKIIEDLIAVYDAPQQADASAARLTAVFEVKYSRAQVIAEAVKDVYRDLLSSNDKALQSNNPEHKNRQPSSATTYIFNEGGGEGDKDRTRVTFKGKLSIGVDDLTNTLLVSAEGEILMRNVSEMIRSLDEAAKPLASVSVVKLSGNTNSEKVREVLNRLLLEAKPAAKPSEGPQPGRPQGEAPNGGQPNNSGVAEPFGR